MPNVVVAPFHLTTTQKQKTSLKTRDATSNIKKFIEGITKEEFRKTVRRLKGT